jgi:hypothetical protein
MSSFLCSLYIYNPSCISVTTVPTDQLKCPILSITTSGYWLLATSSENRYIESDTCLLCESRTAYIWCSIGFFRALLDKNCKEFPPLSLIVLSLIKGTGNVWHLIVHILTPKMPDSLNGKETKLGHCFAEQERRKSWLRGACWLTSNRNWV